MTLLNTKSYGHQIDLVIPAWRTKEDNEFAENYIIYWKWDYRDGGSHRTRGTQSRTKRTTLKGALRFAKKHNIEMPKLDN